MPALFSGPPKMPTIAAPAVMPTQNSQATSQAQQQQLQNMYATSGRQSTILTDTSDKLG